MLEVSGAVTLEEGDGFDLVGEVVPFEGTVKDETTGQVEEETLRVLVIDGPGREVK